MIEISNKRKNEKGNISFNVITKIKNTQNYYLQKKKNRPKNSSKESRIHPTKQKTNRKPPKAKKINNN